MKKILLLLLMLCSVLHSYSQSPGSNNYPYFNSMFVSRNDDTYKFYNTANTDPSDLPVVDPNVGTKITTFKRDLNQHVGTFLKALAFESTSGVVVDFEYYIDSQLVGSTGNTNGIPNANGTFDGGFAINLLDITDAFVTPSGSSGMTSYSGYNLGYTYNRASGDSRGGRMHVGQRGGFLSFGFDPSGTYKQMQHTSEDWVNGVNFSDTDPAKNTWSDVTIRGRWNPDFTIALYPGSPIQEYYGGYPVLISQNAKSITNAPTYSLNPTDGSYTIGSKSFSGFSGFSGVRPDARSANGDVESNNYRRGVCSVVIGTDASGIEGYFLNVTIYYGLIPVEIIKDYFVNPNIDFNYKEMPSCFAGNVDTYDKLLGQQTLEKISMKLPDKLALSITGSTSDSPDHSQNSMIRNMNVYLPFSPLLYDYSSDSICSRQGTQVVLNVLGSAKGYNSNDYNLQTGVPTASYGSLELNSFAFQIFDPNSQTYGIPITPHSITTSRGIYDYVVDEDRQIGYIIFTSNGSNIVDNTPEYIHYNINNKATSGTVDVGADRFRSRIATAKVNFLPLVRCPKDEFVIMNKHVTNKIKID